MAVPTVVSTSTAASDASSSFNTAYPSGIVAGDLILILYCIRTSNYGDLSITTGFNQGLALNTLSRPHFYVYYKYADGTETGSINLSTASGGFAEIASVALLIRGGIFNPYKIDSETYTLNESVRTCPSVPAIASDLVLRIAATSGGTVHTIPTGTTLVREANSGGGGASVLTIASHTGFASETGTADYTLSVSFDRPGYVLTLGIQTPAPAIPTRRTLQLETRLNTRLRTSL